MNDRAFRLDFFILSHDLNDHEPTGQKNHARQRWTRPRSRSLRATLRRRPAGSQTISWITLPKGVPIELLLRHPLAIDACYCSLNNSCWKLHATPGVMNSEFPRPVAFCPIGATINSYVQARP